MTTRPRVAEHAPIDTVPEISSPRRRWAAVAGFGLAVGLLLAPLAVPAHPAHAADAPAAATTPAPAEAKITDRFYSIDMMGGRAGWMHARETVAGDGTITNDSTLQFSLKRGPISIDVRMETQFVERADGTPVSMRSFQQMAKMPIESTYTFTPEGVRVSTKQGAAQPIESLEPLPQGEWLTPGGADRFVKARRAAGAKEVTFRTIDPTAGLKPVVVTRTEGQPEKMMVLGREIDVVKAALKTTLSQGQNVSSTEYSDNEGVLVKSNTSMGGIDVTMSLVTRDEAMKEGAAPEIMVATFLAPDKPIKNARHSTRAAYTVSAKDGALDDIARTGSQHVERIDASTLKVTVDSSMPNAPAPDEADPARFTKSTPMANAEDPAIRAIASDATKDLPADCTVAQKAEALRRSAHEYINAKNLGVGFASASEVAKTRTGDCTEHAVFLVALLRAQGIPARAAAGLIYADQFAGASNIFGYHMWAQALLDTDKGPRWVDLDATLPDGTPYDATHIALATTDLSGEDAASSMLPIATVMGRLTIKVESVEHAGGDK